MLARVARILVRAGVIPRPSIKTAVLNVSDVVGRHIIAKEVALIGGAPQGSSLRLDGLPNAVADAGSEDAQTGAIRIELEHVGTVNLGGIAVRVIHVGVRSDCNEHLLAVGREDYAPRPVPAAIRVGWIAAGQSLHDHF